ncbi:MAG: MBL fold metallo-hydrolase [Anaerolineae bacterium]|jgi:metallo-beta-lactamase family protein|nr:MBL fold metallo-hydrolase [Anaerolineae bacterium]MDH7473229.1 MBL fold metallo-hydrolase [Anaerolineae bacterium]
MKIAFLGAIRTVTGSMHLLTINGRRILLECGLFQGRRQESFERNRNLPFDASSLEAMVLSHAHIDHSGNIPNLVKAGFQGNIYATFATRDLASAMLRDSAHIQEQDVAYVNKKRAKSGLLPVEPIYTRQDAVDSLNAFVGIGYHRTVPVTDGVHLTFYDAGHILGSAIVVLDIEENGHTHRLAFSGDLGRKERPILRDPEVIPSVETLIIESTYGDRRHDTLEEADRELRRVVNDTYQRGGKVIIPAFSVGRTQEIVYSLHHLMQDHKIPDLPVFVDSPLSTNVTEIFRLHPECFDEETNEFIASGNNRDPFGFHRLRYIRDVEDSKALNFLREPAIIISASGMCEAGRILHHLKNNIEDPRNTVLIVGWQSPDTLGRKLVEKQEKVRIFGEEYDRRAQVEVINGFSAHADRDELLDYVRHIKNGLRRVFVVHGEEQASLSLADGLRALGVPEVLVPEPGDEVEF